MNSTKNQLETVILAGISFSGDIKGAHDLFLNGEIEGTVALNSRLFVGQTGKLKGQIEAESIIVEGEVEGTMKASERIEIRDGGKCIGDVYSPSIMISDKAFFEGQVKMQKTNPQESGSATQNETAKSEANEKATDSSARQPARRPNRVKIVDVDDDNHSSSIAEDSPKQAVESAMRNFTVNSTGK